MVGWSVPELFLLLLAVAVVTADLAHCFFVGDAAGRPEDFAATDK